MTTEQKKLEVRSTPQLGKFLIALNDFERDQVVYAFPNIVEVRKDRDVYTVESSKGHVYNEVAKFIAHSCNPNIVFDKETLEFRSNRFIFKDEILAFDYLANESEISNPFTCQCGATNCVGEVK